MKRGGVLPEPKFPWPRSRTLCRAAFGRSLEEDTAFAVPKPWLDGYEAMKLT